MAKNTDNNSPVSSAEHDNLLKSLESIKDLLVESETKISAARESIALANASSSACDSVAAPAVNVAPPLPGVEKIETPVETLPLPEIEDNELLGGTPPEPVMATVHDPDHLVPMLEDVVVPGAQGEPELEAPEIEDLIEQVVAGEPEGTAPAPTPSAQDAGRLFAELANNLENALHDALIQAVVQLETDFKQHIDTQISELRKQLGLDEDN